MVQRETWTGSITVEKTGAGVTTVIIDGKRLDALEVPDYCLKAAVAQKATPAVEAEAKTSLAAASKRLAAK